METITYTQVQQLVEELPETKLPLVYRFLLELADKDIDLQSPKDIDLQSPQADFMRLSPEERHRLLSEQAEQMKSHYEHTADERAEWQAGEFIDERES